MSQSIPVAPAPPQPLTPTSAANRLIGLFQVGRSLERYVEEFVELAYLTNWSDARLIALFLDGLDENTIRFDEPDDYFSLKDAINLILYLNGSNFLVDEVQDVKCSSCPVLPETRVAWPVGQPPSSSACLSSELFSCVTVDPHTSAGSRRRRRRKRKTSEPSPVSTESSPDSTEPSPVSTEPSPNSAEPTPVPVGLLVVFEGMDWTPLQANESAPVAANEPVSPVAANEPVSPVAANEPASRVSAGPASPVSAEPASSESAEPVSPVSAEPAPTYQEPANTAAAAHELIPTRKPTSCHGPVRPSLNLPKRPPLQSAPLPAPA
ncbi:hypothetical protein DPX16_12189 [Anabarilius grahami]|uniref:Uncharacterized protein n=1 Tax=Anabarilius grahami TaxID=495550 RepID=A0A3N0YQU4_ANAGA|nr:hypothetical protein DPX16_12189 [Anabarilius grahami]